MRRGGSAALGGATALTLGLLSCATATAAPSEAVDSEAWRAWLAQQQVAFVARTAEVPLAVDLQVTGSGDQAQATAEIRGTVNADGSMLVTLSTPQRALTILCATRARCWARSGTTAPEGRWRRIAAGQVSSLRAPLLTASTDLPTAARYSIDGRTGQADLVVDAVEVHASVSFAARGYRETQRLIDASDGLLLTAAKTLSPTSRVTVRPPRSGSIGRPWDLDVIPDLP